MLTVSRREENEIVEVVETLLKEKWSRSGPRSRLVEALIVLLHGKPMKAAEIAQYLGYNSRYISSYLSYWRVRGLFEYVNGLWQLTPKGEQVAQLIISRYQEQRFNEYLMIAKQILGEQVKTAVNDNNTQVTPHSSSRSLSFIAGKTGQKIPQPDRKHQAECLKQLINYNELPDEEKEVLDLLLEHYTKWNSTYMYVDQIIEQLQANEIWLMKILKSLQAKHLIYLYRDPRLGTRVGFSRSIKKLLGQCAREQDAYN